MRFNDVIDLLEKPDLSQDEAGNVREGQPRPHRCFCNTYTVGADAWATAFDLGLRADAEVQMRACDYHSEEEARYHEDEYDIERVVREGDFVRLQLGRHASND